MIPTTPGAIASLNEPVYVIELDAMGSKALVAIQGFGGNAIAVDMQGYLYAAGAFGPTAPTTPGVFQASPAYNNCPFQMRPSQHVAKFDPTGTVLIYSTYISGSFGATPSGIAVDVAGNVILAGSTDSPDYPTTPAAYQPEYFANPGDTLVPPRLQYPPMSAGYVTKLNASGSGLIWSTLIGGSGIAPCVRPSCASGGTPYMGSRSTQMEMFCSPELLDPVTCQGCGQPRWLPARLSLEPAS